jgi:hypothetical protein
VGLFPKTPAGIDRRFCISDDRKIEPTLDKLAQLSSRTDTTNEHAQVQPVNDGWTGPIWRPERALAAASDSISKSFVCGREAADRTKRTARRSNNDMDRF